MTQYIYDGWESVYQAFPILKETPKTIVYHIPGTAAGSTITIRKTSLRIRRRRNTTLAMPNGTIYYGGDEQWEPPPPPPLPDDYHRSQHRKRLWFLGVLRELPPKLRKWCRDLPSQWTFVWNRMTSACLPEHSCDVEMALKWWGEQRNSHQPLKSNHSKWEEYRIAMRDWHDDIARQKPWS